MTIIVEVVQTCSMFKSFPQKKQTKNCRMAIKIQCVREQSLYIKLVQKPSNFELYEEKTIYYMTNVVSTLKKLNRFQVSFAVKTLKNIGPQPKTSVRRSKSS